MQKIIHRADTRGFADRGWLVSRHTFSFAGYYDPDRIFVDPHSRCEKTGHKINLAKNVIGFGAEYCCFNKGVNYFNIR